MSDDFDPPASTNKRAQPLDPHRLPWERQPREKASSYAAFCAYRDAGVDRRVGRLAAQDGRNLNTAYNLSQRWRWTERARAWDDEQDRLTFARRDEQSRAELEDQARRRRAAGENQERVAAALLRVAIQRLVGDSERGIAALNPAQLTAAACDRFIRTAVQLQRAALGMDAARWEEEPTRAPAAVRAAASAADHDFLADMYRGLEESGLLALMARSANPEDAPAEFTGLALVGGTDADDADRERAV